jgi:hypothetical protein
MRADTRFGVVSGHVDVVLESICDVNYVEIWVKAPDELIKYVRTRIGH